MIWDAKPIPTAFLKKLYLDTAYTPPPIRYAHTDFYYVLFI